jgi:hypothetical protein
VPRHSRWRRTPYCRATEGGAALSAAPLRVALQIHQPRHRERRGKKGYSDEIFSQMVYYLKSFQVWVNFV